MEISRDWLFDQEINPLGKQWQRYLRMQAGGRRDHDGIGQTDKLDGLRESRAAMSLGDPLS